MKKKIFLGVLILFSLLHSYSQTVNLVRIENLAEQIVGESIVKKIFEANKISVTIEAFPGLRCNQLALSGEKDGEMMRIFNYGVKNPTLIRVPTPYYYLETTVFIKKGSNVVVNKKEDLAKYSIVVVRGVQHTADITEGLSNVNIVDNTEQMLKFVQLGRADVALANKIDGLAVLKKAKIEDVVESTVLAKHDLYIYLHPNKKDLVDILDKTIKNWKNDKTLDKLISEAESNFVKGIK